MYLQFLKPLTPTVEKTESSWVKVHDNNPKNMNALFSQCQS